MTEQELRSLFDFQRFAGNAALARKISGMEERRRKSRSKRRGPVPLPQDLEEQLYLQYHGKVSGYMKSSVANPRDAEDLLTLVFLRAIEFLKGHPDEMKNAAFHIYVFARGAVRDYLGRKGRPFAPGGSAQGAGLAEKRLLREETLELLPRAMDSLEEQEGDLVLLYCWHGYSLQMAAELLNISGKSAKALQESALKKIGQVLFQQK